MEGAFTICHIQRRKTRDVSCQKNWVKSPGVAGPESWPEPNRASQEKTWKWLCDVMNPTWLSLDLRCAKIVGSCPRLEAAIAANVLFFFHSVFFLHVPTVFLSVCSRICVSVYRGTVIKFLPPSDIHAWPLVKCWAHLLHLKPEG